MPQVWGQGMSRGRINGYRGVVWIEGDGWEAVGWTGPLRVWKARRYARRNGIVLADSHAAKANVKPITKRGK